jgi:hypothetical protein
LYDHAAGWIELFPGAPELLLHTLELDHDVDLEIVSSVVHKVVERGTDPHIRVALLRCVTAHLDPARGRESCERVVKPILADVFNRGEWTDLHLDAAIRIAELGLESISISEMRARQLLNIYGNRRPDFAARIHIITAP